MIWDPDSKSENANTSTVVSHIAAEIDAYGGMEWLAKAENVEELAKAIEHFLAQQGDGSCVESKYLVMLAARALSSLGEGNVARRLLLYGTGLVVPSEWDVTGGDAVWVLDLRQITVRDDASLELVFFGSLNIILEAIVEVWDETHGRGTLGLRHICSAVGALMGGGGSKKQAAELADEIRTLCRRKLEQIARQRGWEHVPQVMDLDV
jgi:hypothetical protein